MGGDASLCNSQMGLRKRENFTKQQAEFTQVDRNILAIHNIENKQQKSPGPNQCINNELDNLKNHLRTLLLQLENLNKCSENGSAEKLDRDGYSHTE